MEEIFSKYKVYIIIFGLVLASGLIYYIYFKNPSDEIVIENVIDSENISYSETKENQTNIFVHISGAVKNPGLIELPENSRINDVINLAGRLLEDANLDYINLAQIVEDGTKIVIPSNSQAQEYKEQTGQIIDSSIYLTNENAAIETNNQNDSKETKVNINKAGLEELQKLNGIGEQTAKKIISYRENNGNFKSIDDIKNVNGIGQSKFENIKDYITV